MDQYTHIGYKDCVNYQFRSSRLYGHREPQAGKTHALNLERHPLLGSRWRALCGAIVHSNNGRNEFGEPMTPNVRPAENGAVTCKQCRRRIKDGEETP